MRCPNCGIVLDPGGQFCGQCGAQSPHLPPRFAEAERQYAALLARHEAGELDEATFHNEVRKLLIVDGRGGHWMVGTDGGDWFWYDGQTWVRRDPPPATPEQPPAPVGVAAPPVAVTVPPPPGIAPPAAVTPPPWPAAPPEAAPPVAVPMPAVRPSRRRWLAAILGGLFIVAILAAVVWWLVWLSSGPPGILW